MADYLIDRTLDGPFRVMRGSRIVAEGKDIASLVNDILVKVKDGKIDAAVHTGPPGNPHAGFLDPEEHRQFWSSYMSLVWPYHKDDPRYPRGPPDGR